MWQYFFPRTLGARHVPPFGFSYRHRGALLVTGAQIEILNACGIEWPRQAHRPRANFEKVKKVVRLRRFELSE